MESVKLLENHVNSVEGLLSNLIGFDMFYDEIVFRGQSRKGNLLPGIARANPSRNTQDLEKKMLLELRRLGHMKMRGLEQDDLSLMILAQHYGMKTRLLDWTSNPLAALWFACGGRETEDAFVYAAGADSHVQMGAATIDPFELEHTVLIKPNLGNERIAAQIGWLSLHRYSRLAGAFVPVENLRGSGLTLFAEFRIQGDRKTYIRQQLDRCGINQATLMPDLAGLCDYLNWKHVV